jgi:hypothetical protein
VKRHRFEPASLVMGLVLIALMTAFILDACRVWELKPGRSVPMVISCLLLVVATVVVTQVVRAVRGRRTRRRT